MLNGKNYELQDNYLRTLESYKLSIPIVFYRQLKTSHSRVALWFCQKFGVKGDDELYKMVQKYYRKAKQEVIIESEAYFSLTYSSETI